MQVFYIGFTELQTYDESSKVCLQSRRSVGTNARERDRERESMVKQDNVEIEFNKG